MKKRVFVIVGTFLILVSIPFKLDAADVWSDCISRDLSLERQKSQIIAEPIHFQGSFNFPEPSPDDSFSTYVYTYGDIMIFSYANENVCRMSDGNGTVVWSDTMKEDDYQLITGLEPGVYKVDIPRRAAVLSGDPLSAGLCCWFATGPDNRPLGMKLLTVGPKARTDCETVLAIWSYQDSTCVTVKNLYTNAIEWEGYLDSADYYINRQGTNPPTVYSVTASKPVSVQEMNGVNGTYVPAFNGTFTGRDFFTYQHWYNAAQDINIVPWEDNTKVLITYLDTGDTVWTLTCKKRGEIKGQSMPTRRPLYIHANKDISVSQTEWASFGEGSVAFYTARGIDRNGLGLGTEFFVPLEMSLTYTLNIYSRLHVIAFHDNTSIIVTRIPKDGGTEDSIWTGTLDRGGYYRYTCPINDADAHAIYHVVSSEPVATVGSCNDRQGSDFYPVEQLYSSSFKENLVHELNGLKTINTIGREIFLSYSCPSGTTLKLLVFDASGRKIDEISTVNQSGVLVWGSRKAPGVYFVVPQGINAGPFKVVLVR